MPELSELSLKELEAEYNKCLRELRRNGGSDEDRLLRAQIEYLSSNKTLIKSKAFGDVFVYSGDLGNKRIQVSTVKDKGPFRFIDKLAAKLADGSVVVSDERFYTLKPESTDVTETENRIDIIKGMFCSMGYPNHRENDNGEVRFYSRRWFDINHRHTNGTFYDNAGFDYEGFDRDGYDRAGFDRNGWDREGYDKDGFDINGIDREGYGRDGFNAENYDREGFGRDGFNAEGRDRHGFDRNGNNINGTKISDDGFTSDGRQLNCYDIIHKGEYLLSVTKKDLKTYYCGLYYPSRYRSYDISTNERELSRRILRFKNHERMNVEFFSKALLTSIEILVQQLELSGDILLVSVPSSHTDNPSSVDDCIRYVQQNNTLSNCRFLFREGFLRRVQSVQSAHENPDNRPTEKQHMETISYQLVKQPDISLILIDDIVTTGTIMAACTELAEKSGVDPENIYRFAFLHSVLL